MADAKITQCEKILQYIEEKGSITTFEAFTVLGCTRLASRICDLKKLGYKFKTDTEKGKNRNGDPVHYTRYTLCN